MGFSKIAVSTRISNRPVELTECNLCDLSKELPDHETWLSEFGLNAILLTNPPNDGSRPLDFRFFQTRRISLAADSYSSARTRILRHLASKGTTWTNYYFAVGHLENALGCLYQVIDLSHKARLKSQTKAVPTKFFEKGDGTVLDRLNSIYNSSKHDSKVGSDSIWLTNSGIECVRKNTDEMHTSLSYLEFEEILKKVALAVVSGNRPPKEK